MTDTLVSVPHFVRGRLVTSSDVEYPVTSGQGYATPKLDLDALVWPRTEPLPAAEVPVAEIIELLAGTSERLRKDSDGFLAQALEALVRTSPYDRRILENSYEDLWRQLAPDALRTKVDNELGGAEVIDRWRRTEGPDGRGGWVRAYPTRIVHVLAGNSPGVAARSLAAGALTKGVNLFKMPSNDLFTATACLRTMAALAPDHPSVRSFSAVYWRGGDPDIESVLFRPQFFDKLVAWGGESAIRNAARYLGPGFELISFDPKNSISMIGRRAFDSPQTVTDAATAGAIDAVGYNQEACTSSRFQFVEGSVDEVDRYCEVLLEELRLERRYTSAVVDPPPDDVCEEIDALRFLEPLYRVFGSADGSGLVVRSADPVDFFPSNKTVNVIPVDSLQDALQHVNVSTQTVGVYPSSLKIQLRNQLAAAGVQRVVSLGQATSSIPGFPHDGFYAMHRFVRWVNDED